MKQVKRPTKRQKEAVAAVTDVPLTFVSPESSLIVQGQYDPATETLVVEFTSGKTYAYAHVTPETWVTLEQAESKGKAFNMLVRPFILGREQK